MPTLCPANRYPAESALHDAANRKAKAAKILAVLADALGDELADAHCAEVGCAAGLITRQIAPHVGLIVGLDYDTMHTSRMGANDQPGLLLLRGDAHHLPFPDESLDVIICAQVYEHVADPALMAQEIHRVLCEGGVCFFSGPNRLDPIEHHYGLPFVSWLPHRLADIYLRLAGFDSGYTEHPLTYFGLRRLWRRFLITDYTADIVREPERFGMPALRLVQLLRHMPMCFLKLLMPLAPNYNWLLTKPERGQP